MLSPAHRRADSEEHYISMLLHESRDVRKEALVFGTQSDTNCPVQTWKIVSNVSLKKGLYYWCSDFVFVNLLMQLVIHDENMSV